MPSEQFADRIKTSSIKGYTYKMCNAQKREEKSWSKDVRDMKLKQQPVQMF